MKNRNPVIEFILEWWGAIVIATIFVLLMFQLGGCASISDHYGQRDRDLEQLELCTEYGDVLTQLAQQRRAGLLDEAEVAEVNRLRPQLNSECAEEDPMQITIDALRYHMEQLREVRDAN